MLHTSCRRMERYFSCIRHSLLLCPHPVNERYNSAGYICASSILTKVSKLPDLHVGLELNNLTVLNSYFCLSKLEATSPRYFFHEAINWGESKIKGSCPHECLNGAFCSKTGTCDCQIFQALGTRCQIVPNMGHGRDGICKTWGQYHFETFDGIYYYFPGNCSYIFAKDCGNLEPWYTVWVHNSPKCRGSVYSCYRSISLFFSDQEEIRIYGHEIKKDGISLTLPQTIGQVFIEKLADYILVKTTFGFSLAWDGVSGIYLKLSQEHKGKSCGLCGNYNGIQSDDFIIQQEDYTEDIAMFANSWSVQIPDDSKCVPTLSDFPNPCSSGMPAFEAIFFKCQILLQFPFLSCHEYIDPYLYIASCVNDLCKTDDDETYCRAATEYARACSHAGHPIQDWRDDFPACTDKCDDSFVHRDCISCCPPTCTFEKQCLGSNLHCLDGCYCADGKHFMKEMMAVLMETMYVLVEFGTALSMTVQYILVKGTGKDKFTITLQKAHCEQNLGLVCLQSITLILEDDFNKQVTLSRGGQILTSPNQGFNLNGIVEIQTLSSLFILLKTTFGLKILFAIDGERIYIQLTSAWKRRTLGLCGTFNGNIRDDFLSPSGMIEGTPQLHANAWRVSSTCFAPVHVPMVDPCNINQQNIGYAAQCDIIHQALFAPCHFSISPGLYYQLCRHDACRCGSACLCNALAHYAYLCGRRGITIDFRAQISFCGVVCQRGMLYHHCSSFCRRSCTALAAPERCSDDCAEGCNCPEGKYYEDTLSFCVPIFHCRCHSRGSVYQPGELIPTPSGLCQCSNGTVKCDEPATPSTAFTSTFGRMAEHKGKCYVPESCPCIWKDWEYLSGEVIATPCYTCVCRRGMFNCTYYPCPAVCTIYGDRHYHSFDGLEYDYISDCQVFLIKSADDSDISVIAQNKKCFDNDIVCSKSVLISVGDTEIYLNDTPYKQKRSGFFLENKPTYQLWKAGYYIAVYFPENDITILWDRKTTIHIKVGPQWKVAYIIACINAKTKNKLSGLCGNFDKCTSNDMTTSNNLEVRNAQVFGDSWALGQIDVTSFAKNCHEDTCNCNLGGDCECLCTNVAAYAYKCCQEGVSIHWRSSSICSLDCEYYNEDYSVKASKYDDSEEFKHSSSFSIEGRCSMLSELSIITFDGNNAALYSMASYILVRIPGEIIVAHIEKCSTNQNGNTLKKLASSGRMHGLCFKKLNLTTPIHKILVNRAARKVEVDSVVVPLPFSSQELSIEDSGSMYMITTPAGLVIKWAHLTGIIDIHFGFRFNLSSDTEGLCGICNEDPDDDLRMQNGTIITNMEDIELFIESWEIEKSFEVTTRRPVRNCTEHDCSHCIELLNRRVFIPCHNKVSPQNFCEKMWINYTYFWNYECDALSAYVALCNRFDICLQWRTPDYCSCTDSEDQPRTAGEVWNGGIDECALYKCLENGSIIPTEPDCDEEPSPICEREAEVVLSITDKWTCCSKKVCGCDMTLCETAIPTCTNSQKLVVGHSPLSCCPQYQCVVISGFLFYLQFVTLARNLFHYVLMGNFSLWILILHISVVHDITVFYYSTVIYSDQHKYVDFCLLECSCENLVMPTCEVGEFTAIDRNFQSDCGCVQYLCEKDDVCVFQAVSVLNPGQSMIKYLEGDFCYTVECLEEKDNHIGFHTLNFTMVNCSKECDIHQVYIPSPSDYDCCGTCKNVSCKFQMENGTSVIYEEGSTWHYNCTTYECVKTDEGTMILNYNMICPPFNETECKMVCTLSYLRKCSITYNLENMFSKVVHKYIVAYLFANEGIVKLYNEGCCKICKREERICQKVIIKSIIRKQDCISQNPVNVTSCDGNCPSATIYNINIESHLRFCKCCRENGVRNLSVPLYCSGNGTEVMHTLQEPIDCTCQWN
ncbi:hypothetical protein GH733_006087 [Mirounga leonina]|nr:hypothetical protein GH733_006087 [Mirounga leonina]